MLRNRQLLLEAIYRAPGADGARRVYADWLLGRGDHRGEFIHLQLDRRQGRATLEQFARERALLDSYHRVWSEPFGAAASVVFERGFGTRVVLRPMDPVERAPGPAWSTVEELYVPSPRVPSPPTILEPFLDSPSLAGLGRIAAPVAMVELLTASARRSWHSVVLTDARSSHESLIQVYERLPQLTTLGLFATYSNAIQRLCAQQPPTPRLRRLEVLWWDNGHYNHSLSRFFDFQKTSPFEEFRWFDTSCRGELVLHRTGPSRYGVAGDAPVIEELGGYPPVRIAVDEIRVYAADDEVQDDYEGVRDLAKRNNAMLVLEQIPRDRVLPTPEAEYV